MRRALWIAVILLSLWPHACVQGGNRPATPDTLALFLVSFSDVNGECFFDSTWQAYAQRHTASDFLSLFAPQQRYVTPDPADPASTPRAPNGEPVYGSVADYFAEMSAGRHRLVAILHNPVDVNGYPQWIPLRKPKSHYARLSFAAFVEEATTAAQQMHLDLSSLPSHRICWIYAGNRWNAIPPQCNAIAGTMMRVHERWLFPYDREDRTAPLTPVGMYCHEYAHLLGAHHHRSGTVSLWDLMGNGQKNAHSGTFGNLPAPVNPWRRQRWGWLEMKLRHGDSLRLNADSLALHTPLLWQVEPQLRFIIDYRDFSSGFMRSAPGGTLTRAPGLLIWRINGTGDSERDVDLLEADGTEGEMNAVTDLHEMGADYSHRFRDAAGNARQLDILLQNPEHLLLRYTAPSGHRQ